MVFMAYLRLNNNELQINESGYALVLIYYEQLCCKLSINIAL